MAEYKTFSALANGWESRFIPDKVVEYSLPRIGKRVQEHIRAQHGKAQPKNSALTIALKGRNAPLKDTGVLQNGVSYGSDYANGISHIFTTETFLADIHEYGRSWKMSETQRKYIMMLVTRAGLRNKGAVKGTGKITIPPRPIWRTALNKTNMQILDIVQFGIRKYLTND